MEKRCTVEVLNRCWCSGIGAKCLVCPAWAAGAFPQPQQGLQVPVATNRFPARVAPDPLGRDFATSCPMQPQECHQEQRMEAEASGLSPPRGPAGAAPAPREGRAAAPHAASPSAPRLWGRRVLPPSLASPTGLRPCPPFRTGKPKRHVFFFFPCCIFFFLPIIRAFRRPRRAPRCNSAAPDLADPRLNFQRKQVITAEKPRLCEA